VSRGTERHEPEGEIRTAGLTAAGNWWSAAACLSADPDLFFPISASGRSLERVAEARAICAGCPVQRQCLAFALRTRQPHGIWGGMTEDERDARRPELINEQPETSERRPA